MIPWWWLVLRSGTYRPLIARNDQGEEIARREEPICYVET